MGNRELIFKAFNNEEVDRVPVGFWFHFLKEAETGDYLRTPSLLEDNVAAHQRFIESFHPDMVKIMSDGFFFYPLSTPLKSSGDLDAVVSIDKNHPWIKGQVELVSQVTAIDADIPYFYNIFAPITSLRFLVGRETLLEWIDKEPDRVSRALDRMGRGLANLAEGVIGAGADGIYLSVQNPGRDKLSDDGYRHLASASDLEVLSTANKLKDTNILHICGYDGIRNKLEAWTDYPAKVFSWAVQVEGVSLGKGKKLFGGRAVLGGFANSPGSMIETGTQERVSEFTRQIIKEAGHRGVVIGADCTLPSSIDLDRLDWVRQAAAGY